MIDCKLFSKSFPISTVVLKILMAAYEGFETEEGWWISQLKSLSRSFVFMKSNISLKKKVLMVANRKVITNINDSQLQFCICSLGTGTVALNSARQIYKRTS